MGGFWKKSLNGGVTPLAPPPLWETLHEQLMWTIYNSKNAVPYSFQKAFRNKVISYFLWYIKDVVTMEILFENVFKLLLWSWSLTYSEFFRHHGWCPAEIFSKFVPPDALKMHSLALFQITFKLTFTKKSFLWMILKMIHVLINKICMAITSGKLWIDLSLCSK